jgi:hypothetical protein
MYDSLCFTARSQCTLLARDAELTPAWLLLLLLLLPPAASVPHLVADVVGHVVS